MRLLIDPCGLQANFHRSYGVSAGAFAEFFWPLVSGLIPVALGYPDQCHELFALTHALLLILVERNSSVIDTAVVVSQCTSLLLGHTTTEVSRNHAANPIYFL